MAYDWDECAPDWEKDETTTVFAQNIFQQLQNLISIEGKHVLDFGCGTGLLTQLISPLAKDIVALDGSEAMIEELDKKELKNVEPVVDHLSRGLVAQHPAFRKQFDFIVASSVCGFIADFQEAADIVYSLLEDDGIFIHWDWLVDENDPEYGLSRVEIVRTLTKAGFSSVETKLAFEVNTPQGLKPVIMGIGRK